MRFVTPRSSRQGASPATRDLSLRLMLRASRTSPLSQSDLVPWHLATTADQTLCPLLVKADAASVGQSIKPCLVRQRHTQCQPGQEGNGDGGVSSAPGITDDLPVAGQLPRTAEGSDQLTGGLRWAILPVQSGLRWNRLGDAPGALSELLGK